MTDRRGRVGVRPSIDVSALQTARGWPTERVFRGLAMVAALSIVVLLIAVAVRLTAQSIAPWQKFGINFLFGTTWDVVNGIYGALRVVAGKLECSCLARLTAVTVR